MNVGSVTIIVQRDAKNEPFARVLYNNQSAFDLDYYMKGCASYLARKSTGATDDKGLVFISTETGDVLEVDQIDRLRDQEYCISGCESGKENINKLIKTICSGANDLDIKAPVFITDGKIAPIFINESSISESYNNLSGETRTRIIQENMQLLDSIIEKPKAPQAPGMKI